MEERLTKIAEASFRKAMAKFSSWGDIGIALKNVQSEIREVSKRTRTVEHVLGHPWYYVKTQSNLRIKHRLRSDIFPANKSSKSV